MSYSMSKVGLTILGLAAGWTGVWAAVIIADHDNPGGLSARIEAESAVSPPAATANYAFVPLPPVGAPLQITEDGTAVLITYNAGNVYAYRWRQGVLTELSCVRPAGTRIKLHAANRNGMVVVVFELPTRAYFAFEGGATKQVVVAWMPESTTPVFLNVPISQATTWNDKSVMRSVDFKFLDDQNRIWGDTNYEYVGPEGNLVWFELARWDAPDAMPTFIGHKTRQTPSVNLLGVSSGSGEPFGLYSPPEAGSGNYYFAGSLGNRLNYVPSSMNNQGWVIGKRGFTSVLSKDGTEYPLPANTSIIQIDDKNNLFDTSGRIWTTNTTTIVSTPTSGQSSYVPLSIGSIVLAEGYGTNQGMIPGDESLRLGYLFEGGNATPAIFVPAELRPDANRDGIITTSRLPHDPDLILAEKNLPWYFWVNDDDDSGETDGNDIPGAGSNGRDSSVNGVRDLVDFFPLHLNIARLLSVLPPTTPGISYNLAQADGAANFLATDLFPESAGKYNSDADVARPLGGKSVTRITPEGTPLDSALLAQASIQNRGVVLVEARAPTTKPLKLEVRRGTELLARLDLPLRFSGVEDMFRHVNLVGAVGVKQETRPRGSPPNWSEKLENNQAFLFVHGYNVNQKQARGWQAEFFKRLWWSGSNAQFWGVTWYGFESQVPVANFTPNYQLNVIHAFGTAPIFKQFIDELRAKTAVTSVNVAAHSLGNLVVSSAISDHSAPIDRYFMLNAAVAAEAYDGEKGEGHVVQSDDGTAFLPHTEWNKERGKVYPPRLWASNWHELFPAPSGNSATDDIRAKLTWRDRFAPISTTKYYDFHSTGEEVLGYDERHLENTPSLFGVLSTELKTYLHITKPGELRQPNGYQTWIYQEQLKGRTTTGKVLGSNYGGWGFNNFILKKTPAPNGNGPKLAPLDMTPEDAIAAEPFLLDSDLQAEPFFRPGGYWTRVGTWNYDPVAKKNLWISGSLRQLYGQSTGSAFASAHRDTLLARMIPAMSPAAGRIPVPKLTADAGEERNFDMDGAEIRPRNGPNPPWPQNRPTPNWRHSDLREVAYPYVRRLYESIVDKGSLKGGTQ
jgi:hypothetical protein